VRKPFSVLLLAVALAACDEQPSTPQAVTETATTPACSDGHGPWTACPEADWIRHVVRRAGYRLTGETGSALIAEGHGASFYIWATPAGRPVEEIGRDEGWQELGRVAGARVWGSREWRWWAAQEHIVWLSAGGHVPALNELRSLIRASKSLTPLS
jgi:hypothetical protein